MGKAGHQLQILPTVYYKYVAGERMEFGLVGLTLLQASASMMLAFALLHQQASLHQDLNYNSRRYDCDDPVKTIVDTSAKNDVIFFSSKQPCIYPDISTHNLTSQSPGYKLFKSIGASLTKGGRYGN